MCIIAIMIPISLNISKDLFIIGKLFNLLIDYLLLSIVTKGIIVILGPGLL